MNIKILLALVGLLSAIAICAVLNLASGVFIPLVIAWFMLQVFRPVINLGRKIRLPPFLNITLVFGVFFGFCVIGIHFCASQIVEFNHAYNLYYSKLNAMTLEIMKALSIPPDTISRISCSTSSAVSDADFERLRYSCSSRLAFFSR